MFFCNLGHVTRKLPYFCGHVPQESGTRAGGSLSKNWPKIPSHANKTPDWRQLRMLILDWWSFWVNEVHKRIWWRGLAELSLSGKVLKTWTSVAILSWVHTAASRTDLLLNTQWSYRGFLDYISHPVLLLGGLGDKLSAPENCSPSLLQELVGRNRFLKLF